MIGNSIKGKGCLREPNDSLPNLINELIRTSFYQLIEWLVDDQFDVKDLISLNQKEMNNAKES